MALGPYRFALKTAAYNELSRQTAYRWPQVDVVERPVALQSVGQGAETLNLKGLIFPHVYGGERQVDAMRGIAGLGTPLPLIDGAGWIWGLYAITSISEARSVFFANGQARKQSFDLNLQRYHRR